MNDFRTYCPSCIYVSKSRTAWLFHMTCHIIGYHVSLQNTVPCAGKKKNHSDRCNQAKKKKGPQLMLQLFSTWFSMRSGKEIHLWKNVRMLFPSLRWCIEAAVKTFICQYCSSYLRRHFKTKGKKKHTPTCNKHTTTESYSTNYYYHLNAENTHSLRKLLNKCFPGTLQLAATKRNFTH